MNVSCLISSFTRRCKITSFPNNNNINTTTTTNNKIRNKIMNQQKILSLSSSSSSSSLLIGKNFNVMNNYIRIGSNNTKCISNTTWRRMESFHNNNNNNNICLYQRNFTSITNNNNSTTTFITKSPLSFNHNSHKNTTSHNIIINTVQKRTMATQKHKRIIKMAKGYRGRAKNTFRAAIRRVEKGLQYAYRDRKVKKRNFRKLWIERINAGVRQHGMSYSRFMDAMVKMNGGLKGSGGAKGIEESALGKKIILNRKVLAELAANEPFSFKAVVDVVKMQSSTTSKST